MTSKFYRMELVIFISEGLSAAYFYVLIHMNKVLKCYCEQAIVSSELQLWQDVDKNSSF